MSNGKSETARLAFFFASPMHFDFLDRENETSEYFECERETFGRLNFEPQILLRAMRMSLYKSLTKEFFVVNPCTRNLSTVNKLYYFPCHEKAIE